jgi:hypothetical protein
VKRIKDRKKKDKKVLVLNVQNDLTKQLKCVTIIIKR